MKRSSKLSGAQNRRRTLEKTKALEAYPKLTVFFLQVAASLMNEYEMLLKRYNSQII